MFIETIEINNILGCAHAKLCFDNQRSSVYLVQSEPKSPFHRAVCTAVKLICSGQYAHIESLVDIKDLHRGSVHLVFRVPKRSAGGGTSAAKVDTVSERSAEDDSDSDAPCTSQQARARELRRQRRRKAELSGKQATLKQQRQQQDAPQQQEAPQQFFTVSARRDFSTHVEQIEYSIDSGPKRRCSVMAFHRKFCTTVDYVLPDSSQGRTEFRGNWLLLISTDLNGKKGRGASEPIFSHFMELVLRHHAIERTLLPKLTTTCLMGHKTLDIVLAADALQVFKVMRTLFEFITYNEYTVWFLIPHMGGYVDVGAVRAEKLDFENMRTCVQLNTKTGAECRVYEWMDVSQAVQDLLLVAFQLAVAFHFKQGIVYLQDELNAVKEHQTMQLVTTAYLQRSEGIETELRCRNYVQRIVDACVKMNVVAIIEYPGGLPLAPPDANVIKCYKDTQSGEWQLKVVQRSACNVNAFIEGIETDLKQC